MRLWWRWWALLVLLLVALPAYAGQPHTGDDYAAAGPSGDGSSVTPTAAGAVPTNGVDRWRVPPAIPSAPQLPQLTQPLVVDGDLLEWAEAASLPIRYRSYITPAKVSPEWQSAVDVGMEISCAWNSDGLCLGAVVAEESGNSQQGGVVIHVDGRTPQRLLKMPVGLGYYRLVIKPPWAKGKGSLIMRASDGKIVALNHAVKKIATGYSFEALMPWSAFPQFTPQPGARLGLQFVLTDNDIHGPPLKAPLTFTYRGIAPPTKTLVGMMLWSLAEKIPTGAQVNLGPMVGLDFPRVFVGEGPLPINVETGRGLTAMVAGVRVVVTSPEGKPLCEQVLKTAPLPPPWQESIGVHVNCPSAGMADGYHTVTANLLDKAGQPIGITARPVMIAQTALRAGIDRIKRADVPALVQDHPYTAAGYLGAAACVEKLKRVVEIGDYGLAAVAVRELEARLDLLETGKMRAAPRSLHDLLGLAAEPEAQVVVDFPSVNTAAVTFCCGAIPFAGAQVRRCATAAQANTLLVRAAGRGLWDLSAKGTVGGRPAMVTTRAFAPELCRLADVEPARQVLLCDLGGKQKRAYALAVQDLAAARVNAVAILPDCPPGVRAAVANWARHSGLSLSGLGEAAKKGSFMIAGDPTGKEAAQLLMGVAVRQLLPRDGTTELTIVSGDWLITTASPARAVAERVAAMVAAARPVLPAAADGLRLQLVTAVAPPNRAPLPPGMDLFSGDMHMHTIYSDGEPTPVGLTLAAMFSYLDFAALSEHNTIDGARLAHTLLAKHGFSYPLIVGEEITTPWAHLNAYPLQTLISWRLTPQGTVAAAHRQGAVIQWNHPDFSNSPWSIGHARTPLTGTEVDAWEHLPPRYDEWKRAGTLPAIVGTTDTHSGTFIGGGHAGTERTIILAPDASGQDLATAIRKKQVVMVSLVGPHFLYGEDETTAIVWEALAEGKGLRAGRAKRLRETLKRADLVGLLRDSPAKVHGAGGDGGAGDN